MSPRTLRTFEEIWNLPPAEQKLWYRVRFEYTVYYYDPLWMALWGRSGESESYLSLGTKRFPLVPGQRLLVEGVMQPSRGMRVDEPRVQVLAENVPLDPVSTSGRVGRSELFNKRLVTVEGYVDSQTTRDANHLELQLVTEGRAILGQLLVSADQPVPQLKGASVRARGVYFARSEPDGSGLKIELWIQRAEDITVTGTLDRDPRFHPPPATWAQLAAAPADQWVHVSGTAKSVEPGRSVTIAIDGGDVVVETPQRITVRPEDAVEAVGLPAPAGERRALHQALVRPTQVVFTSVADLWRLPEEQRQQRCRVRLDLLVYFYDPAWKAVWGRAGGSDDYLSLGDRVFPIRSGQRILVEGSTIPARGMVVEDAQVTLLADVVPLAPIPTDGRIGDVERFQRHFVTVDGLVDRQQVMDRQRLQLDLIVDGRPVIGRLLLDEGAAMPNWTNALLRLNGVYSATQDPTGSPPTIEVWTPGLKHVEVRGTLATDPRFAVAATPVDQLSKVAPGTTVKVAGTARGQQPGRLFIRDETGQLAVLSPQAQTIPVGAAVEAVGTAELVGTEWALANAVYRRIGSLPPPRTDTLPTLRLADQLRELSPEEAAKSYPVQLSGIVLWARPNAEFFYVHDSSGGVCVFRPPGTPAKMFVGTKVQVTGTSAPGKFTPVVLASTVEVSATIELPDARPVTLEQAWTGIEDAQWVSMGGYVRGVAEDGPWTRIDLTTSGGEFAAFVPHSPVGPSAESWAKLPGAILRVRGVCAAVANEKRQLTGIRIWVPSFRFLEVEEEPPTDWFATALRPIASLRQFQTAQALNRRVRVAGVVVYHAPGRFIHLQDGPEGLLVLSRGTAALVPGDRIEAVGFPGRENSRAVLREAVYRRVAAGPEPAPVRVRGAAPIDAEMDGRLTRLEGQLLSVTGHNRGVRLLLQQQETIVEALADMPIERAPGAWAPRSQVALTGVYEVRFDEYRRPGSVRLLLRSPADVTILRRAPWWTARRTLAATAVLALGAVLGFGWVFALRRQVRQQTGVLRERVEGEKAARLEAALARASKLESLGVLAGGIAHDFNNLLTVVLGNLSLARLDERVPTDTMQCLAEGERAATRARDLTQQLLTFAKGGEPIKTSSQLEALVREAAQFGLHGSNVRCEFDFTPHLWPALVDKGQTGQVVHNLIINASQAMPAGGVVQLRLRNEEVTAARPALPAGRYVRLSVTDHGHGIAPENLSRIFEPYFTTKQRGNGLGLATVYSIVKKHQGHIEVRSQIGAGSTFDVWLPAADTAPTPAPAAAGPAPSGADRVLLMDDEPSIRSLGSAVMRRMGIEATVVSDGRAAVEAYARARAEGRPYRLVILDLTVPGGMGGAEAMQQLRALDPQVRAVVSSGYSKDPVMAHYADYGFCARVPKPYQASELMTAIRVALDQAAG
jgi:signal transduction histidine kinase/CheY-like chemotaxis protein